LKVGIVAPEFLPVWGGVGTHITELVSHMPQDVELVVITLRRRIPGTSEFMERDEVLGSIERPIELIELIEARDTFLYNARFQIACARHIPRIVKEHDIQLLHTHFPHMSDVLLRLLGYHMPTITTVHTTIAGQLSGTRASGMGFFELEPSERFTLMLSPFLRTLERCYLSRTHDVITVSRWLAGLLEQHYPSEKRQLDVIPNGVDAQVYAPRRTKRLVDTSSPIVLFTGRLVSAKGISVLIEAMEEVLKSTDAHFVFVGGGSPAPYIERIERRGIPQSSYTFLGYLKTREDMVAAYNMADVYVAPTLYENLPIRILEAMACERAVVASDVCAIPELIQSGVNGILVPPRDPHALAHGIAGLLEDGSLRRELGRRARQTVLDGFTWDTIAMRTAAVYERVLEGEG